MKNITHKAQCSGIKSTTNCGETKGKDNPLTSSGSRQQQASTEKVSYSGLRCSHSSEPLSLAEEVDIYKCCWIADLARWLQQELQGDVGGYQDYVKTQSAPPRIFYIPGNSVSYNSMLLLASYLASYMKSVKNLDRKSRRAEITPRPHQLRRRLDLSLYGLATCPKLFFAATSREAAELLN